MADRAGMASGEGDECRCRCDGDACDEHDEAYMPI